ncbi:MAG TPA: flavin reductase family protein [Candidatus Xenobia bacterium]
MIEPRKFRDITGRFATGVTVVTSRLGDEVHGMTVNSFCAVSLSPPLVLFCAGPGSRTTSLITRSGVFAISILSQAQEAISVLLASSDTKAGDELLRTIHQHGGTGCPIMPDCVAYVDCRVESILPGGDHAIIVGRVEAMELGTDAPPLLFHASRYRHLA